MEITLKTADNFFDGRVRIEILADQAEAPAVGQALSPETLGRLAGQRDRIEELEARLEAAHAARDTYQSELIKAEAELIRRTEERDEREEARAELETKMAADHDEDHQLVMAVRAELTCRTEDLHAERKRADENNDWAERTEAIVEKIRQSVWSPTLDTAMENRGNLAAIPIEIRQELVDAVAFVRATTGQPY